MSGFTLLLEGAACVFTAVIFAAAAADFMRGSDWLDVVADLLAAGFAAFVLWLAVSGGSTSLVVG